MREPERLACVLEILCNICRDIGRDHDIRAVKQAVV